MHADALPMLAGPRTAIVRPWPGRSCRQSTGRGRTIGALRGLRRSAGFRAVQDAVADPAVPGARQTITRTSAAGWCHRSPSSWSWSSSTCLSLAGSDEADRGPALAGGGRRGHGPHDALLPHDRGDAADGAPAAAAVPEAFAIGRLRSCSPTSTSGSLSRTSTPRSSAIGGSSACSRRTARSCRARASRRCCSGWAPRTCSCSGALGPDTPVGRFLERRGRASTTSRTAWTTWRRRWSVCAPRACAWWTRRRARIARHDDRVRAQDLGGVLVELIQEG